MVIIICNTSVISVYEKKGCDYVIALTHMRTTNDKKLADNTTDIDLILGGHDHVYEVQKVSKKQILHFVFFDIIILVYIFSFFRYRVGASRINV